MPHTYVMHKASPVLAAGADFRLMGTKTTHAKVEQAGGRGVRRAHRVGEKPDHPPRLMILREMGYKVAAIRHPMPYGDLAKQAVQRFADYADLDEQDCTIEEREEYEPHLDNGVIVFAGVDYERILRQAEERSGHRAVGRRQQRSAFLRARPVHRGRRSAPARARDVLSPRRGQPAHGRCLRDQQGGHRHAENVITVRESLRRLNPDATVIDAASPIFVDDAEAIRGKRVLVIEDGPTLTHGEMAFGAGVVAARRFGAAEIIDPRPYAVGASATFQKYPATGDVLPAMGYGDEQMADLEQTINERRRGPGPDRHAHRPDARVQDRQAHPARALRAAGDRSADPRGRAQGKVWLEDFTSPGRLDRLISWNVD